MNMIGSVVCWTDAGGCDYIFFLLETENGENGTIMVALVK